MIFLLVSLVLIVLGFYCFKKYQILDNPKKYGFKRNAVPYSFGLVLYFIFLVSSYFYGIDIINFHYIYLSTLILVCMSFYDDRYGLHPLIRLSTQFGLAIYVVLNGVRINEITNPLNFEIVSLSNLSFLISVIWIVFLTNVMNFLDGVEGLSSGVSSVGFFTIGMLSFIPNMHVIDQSNLLILTFLMAGVSFLAFILEFPLRFPKLLVGDSGTMLYGFLLATFSMIAGGKLFTLLIVLLIPILDALFVILYRIYKRRLPFIGDRNHFHHKLLELNFQRSSITFIYFLISLVLGLISIFAWNTYLKMISLSVISLAFLFLLWIVWNRSYK